MSAIIERERDRRRRRRKVLRWAGREPADGGGLVAEVRRAFEHGWHERAETLLDGGVGTGDDLHVRALRARFAARPQGAVSAMTRAAADLAEAGEHGAALEMSGAAAALALVTWDVTAAEPLRAVLAAAGPVSSSDPAAVAVRAVADRLAPPKKRDLVAVAVGAVADRRPPLTEGGPAAVAAGADNDRLAPLEIGDPAALADRPAPAGSVDPASGGLAGGLAALARGEAVAAGDLLGAEAAALRRGGRLGVLVHVLALRAQAAVEGGDWAAAAGAATECRVLAERTGQPVWQACATAVIALVEAVRGDGESAGRHAAEAEVNGGALIATTARFARGVALLSAERYRDAYTVLLPLMAGPRPRDADGHVAEAALRCGERMPETTDLYARALAEGDEELFVRARASAPSPWVTARVDLEYGSWLRRQRRVTESRLPVESARHTFEVLGASTWARRAGRELRASGGAPSGVLSAQEWEIARFAADGLSNREIGQRMFLSPRTIGSHLYRIFPKLAVTSRAQLAGRILAVTNEPATWS
ncbi:LuxR C-terminal-related transcriptional regulator [Actinoplanes sp. NPDC049596]|uniref:LuxR C-terminal-related transcriptional regulator n=1 Tax=unclassified Actinoplanes TaxID=2626549 RepID=UPI0034330590